MVLPAYATVGNAPGTRGYRVRFFHTHTGERLDIVYREGDRYLPEALAKLNFYLRDHRTGDVHQYDPKVFDLLHDLMARLREAALALHRGGVGYYAKSDFIHVDVGRVRRW